jgi:hypothetical protein
MDPVFAIASRSRILPGPSARSDPKSTRTVNRISPIELLAQEPARLERFSFRKKPKTDPAS